MADRFKNAGFKNTEEDIKQALKRMIDGEVFYLEGGSIRFQLDRLMSGDTHCFKMGVHRLDQYELCNLDKWRVKVDWRENIGEGVWCWVRDLAGTLHPELIKRYEGEDREYPYIDSYGTAWEFAEPMTREEVEKYIL